LGSKHNQIPREITVDKNPAYLPAIDKLKNDKILPINIGIQQIKYLNNIIEQDHRSIKRIVNPMLGFRSFRSATKTLKRNKAMNIIKKEQTKNLNYFVLNEDK
jgi:Transposase and inactivated derivatives